MVCDPRAEALERICCRYPAVQPRSSYSKVLEDDAVDAVAIATPVRTHFALATAALEAGKHVFVEKPLAASVGRGVGADRARREHGAAS